MDNNDLIPPLIQSKISFKNAAQPSAPSGFQTVAQICWWLPVFAGLLCYGVSYWLKSGTVSAGNVVLASLGAGGLTLVMCGLSFLLGIIALCGIPKHGAQGILWRSLRGMLASGIILSIMGQGFVHGYQAAVRARSARLAQSQTAQDARDDSKKETDGSTRPTPATAQSQAAPDKSSQAWPADTSLAAKATSHFQRELQSLSKDYADAAQQIRNPWVLDMNSVGTREELAARKDTVQKFMASNEKLLAFVMNGEKHYRDDLARFDIPEEVCEGALKTYRRSTEEWNFLTLKARQSDQQIGTALLGMLETLDAGWGKWKYSPENKTPIFSDSALVAKYNAFFKAMQTAHVDQKQTLSQLGNLPPTRFTDVMQTAQR